VYVICDKRWALGSADAEKGNLDYIEKNWIRNSELDFCELTFLCSHVTKPHHRNTIQYLDLILES